MTAGTSGEGRAGVAPRAAGLLAGALAAGLLWVAFREVRSPGDYRGFVAFGRAALDGVLPYSRALESLYRPGLHAAWATWPPAFAPAAAALALVDRVSRPLGVILVQTAALGGLATTLIFFAQRVGTAPPRGSSAARAENASPKAVIGTPMARPGVIASPQALALLVSLPVLLAVLVSYPLLLDSLQNTQVNLLVLGLVAASFGAFDSRRTWAGGLMLGAATSFKAVPLLLLGYLAWRGRWKDLGAAAGGVVVWWLAVPALLLGSGGGPGGLVSGSHGGLLGSYASWFGHATSGSLLVRGSNQSLLATILRLLPTGPAGRGAGMVLFAACVVTLAVLTLVAFGRPFRTVGRRREVAELAVMLVAMNLLSPLAWKAHYVSLAPLVLVLAAGAGIGRRTSPHGARIGWASGERIVRAYAGRLKYTGTAVLLALAFLALCLTGRDLVGHSLSASAERWGVVTWTALALFAAALWGLWKERRPEAPADEGGREPPPAGVADVEARRARS